MDDLISRQAIDTLVDELARAISDERCCMSRGRSTATIMQDILDLPSVKQEPKTGHWIYDYTSADGHKTYHCSECGCYLQPKHSEPLNSFKWCSSCGVKMVEPQEISEHNLKMWKDIYEEEKRRERRDKE